MSTTGHGISGDESVNVGEWRCRSLRMGSQKDDAPFRCCMGANKSGVKICETCLNTREDGLWVKIDAAEQVFPIATPKEASLHWRLRDPARGKWRCRLRDSTRPHHICDTVNEASAGYCEVSLQGCGRKKTEGLFQDPPGFPGSATSDTIREISRYFAIITADPDFDKIVS